MIDIDNVLLLGDIGLGSPLLTKLQAMQSLFGGFYDQHQGSASAQNYVRPSSSSVNDNIYLHDVDQLSTQQALHHTLSHDIRLQLPFDSSSTSPAPLSHAHVQPAVVDDAGLINHINLLSHVNTISTGLSCRQEKGVQDGDPKAPCLSYATSLAHYLSQGSFGCSLSSPFDTLARRLQYYDPSQVTSEIFQRDDNILVASDVQDSNTSGSVNCMVNRSGHNPPKAALSTSTSTSSTPSSISNGQLAQLAKETLQAWMAYDTSSFTGKKGALMNINSASMVNEGAYKKRSGMSANSTEQKKKRKKRRRISHKNVEEMETQRMTHIAVERNRRKQMNEHLRALRSLMPQSYIQRGDQASIVGGTIRFVEELEQVLQSLRLQKQLRAHHVEDYGSHIRQNHELLESPVDEIYANTQSCMANVEVTMLTSKTIFLKVLAQKKPHQLLDTLLALSKLSLRVTHLNITTIGLIIVYSFNLEMDCNSECQLPTPCELAESIKHTLCV